MRYTIAMQLDKTAYELLRKRYGKRVTVKPSTLVEMAVAEAVRDQAARVLNETGYAPIENDTERLRSENRALRSILAYELTLFSSEVDDKIAETLAAEPVNPPAPSGIGR